MMPMRVSWFNAAHSGSAWRTAATPKSSPAPGTLIGELALVVAMERPSTALSIDYSTVIRIPRSLFQRVLDSDPAAARRLRDALATRASQIASDILMVGAKLGG